MAIEPGDAWREALEPVIPRSGAMGKSGARGVLPGTDDEPRAGCDVVARVAANAREVGELARQKRIEPAGRQQNGPLQCGCAIVAVDRAPVLILVGMIDPVVEERNVLHGAVVRFDERETVVSALEHRVPGRVVVGAAAPYRPEERAREREGAARIEHAVEIRAADLHDERR